jgi:carboxypeptidase C (cathepsin A)
MTMNALSRRLWIHCCLLAAALCCSSGFAQEPAGKPAPKPETKALESKDGLVTSSHSATIGGVKIDYQATAGTLALKNEEDKTTANIFFVAYTKTGVQDLSSRPVTFAFNGGPGSSAVWLHLGCLGPRRIDIGDDGQDVAPPYRTVDNESSLLDLSDLVFIDPVSTGFSRAVPAQNARKFHGVNEDVRSVGEFIRLYVTRFKRWNSPKYLAGESYGTTRASALVGHMQTQLGMNFNGVILLAPVLNFQTILFDRGNDLAYALFLPGYTATAWYHKKLAPELLADFHKTLDEARKFAQTEYTVALMKGSALAEAERQQIIRQIARYTGLDEDYVGRKDLRIDYDSFAGELLRKERQTIGRYDSRLKAPAIHDRLQQPFSDPSYSAVQGPITATFNQYLREDLKYTGEGQYEILNLRVHPWEFDGATNRYLDVSNTLREAMTQNRNLRVLVATGYYDLATPFLSTEYTIHHLNLSPAIAGHVSLTYYDAGHMMYIHKESRHKLKQDLGQFLGAGSLQSSAK